MPLAPLFDALEASGLGLVATSPEAARELRVTAEVPASAVRLPKLPFVAHRVDAGFPSPADDYVEDLLSLDELIGSRAPSCFFMRVQGESMTGEGIFDGDVLVVDRAAEPTSGSIVIAAIDGELTVKRFIWTGRRPRLLAANPAFPPIEIAEGQELLIRGVVTHSLRDHRRRTVRKRDAA